MPSNYSGLYTALVTPFNEDKSVDYRSLEKLIDEQIQAKVDGLVILGTTGESPVINDIEAEKIISLAVKISKSTIKIIVGAGSNNTELAIKKSKQAQNLGADAILSVNPYYNKPPQEGLYRHFEQIADSIDIPMILYNIKGRSAVNLEIETLLRLSRHKNIIGVKEASGDLSQIMDLISQVDNDFFVLSGDDALTYPIMSLGGHGIVSVMSNIFPREMKNIVWQCLTNNFEAAKQSHYKLYNFMKVLLSISSNPIPVKTILAHIGKIKEEFRLPLCQLGSDDKQKLIKIYTEISG
ncbi:MAG: 4-hydroxy-tetrahydrodipicolinate synthase [Rickettsiales bacterium]|jgi:4-hydroxy-tetrahydrodipicolinate synthase|nr:4-hydroxy-tetrahydrodipicolinate synthase [Rickettsiales bacterium]